MSPGCCCHLLAGPNPAPVQSSAAASRSPVTHCPFGRRHDFVHRSMSNTSRSRAPKWLHWGQNPTLVFSPWEIFPFGCGDCTENSPCPLLLVTPSPFPRPRGLPAFTEDILGIAARDWSITGCRAPRPMGAEHHSSSLLNQMAAVPHTELTRGTEPQLCPLNSSLQSKTNIQCIFCAPHAKAHTCTRKAARCCECQSHAPPGALRVQHVDFSLVSK